MYRRVIQLYKCTNVYIFFFRFFHYSLLQGIEYSSLCYIVGPYCLSKMIFQVNTTYYKVWRRQWHSTPVLLPGKSRGRRSLVGCSPWGGKESDTTEWLPFHFSLSWIGEGNPTLVFLPRESQGRGSLVGCRLWGRTESDTTEAT